jgi:hypothetical protein
MSILVYDQDVSALLIWLRHHNAKVAVIMILSSVHLPIKETTKATVQTGEVEPVELVVTQRFAWHTQIGFFSVFC